MGDYHRQQDKLSEDDFMHYSVPSLIKVFQEMEICLRKTFICRLRTVPMLTWER